MTILRKRNIDDDWFYESLTFALLAFRIPWKTAQRTGCYFPFFHNCGDPAFLRPTSEPPRTKTMLVSERSFVTPFLWALALYHVSKNHHPFANNVLKLKDYFLLCSRLFNLAISNFVFPFILDTYLSNVRNNLNPESTKASKELNTSFLPFNNTCIMSFLLIRQASTSAKKESVRTPWRLFLLITFVAACKYKDLKWMDSVDFSTSALTILILLHNLSSEHLLIGTSSSFKSNFLFFWTRQFHCF